MADKLRVIQTANTSNNSNLAACGNESLIINTGGGLYLGNGTNSPSLISDNGENKYLKLSGGALTGPLTSQNILPGVHHTTSATGYSLGSSSYQFNTTYTRYIDTASNYNLRLKAGGTEHINMLNGQINITGNVLPISNNTYTLGNSTYKWNNIYATTFTGSLAGNASSASSAAKLTGSGGSAIALGSKTQPVYFENGLPVECEDMAIAINANVQAVDTGDVLDDVNVDYATTAYVDNKVANINLTGYATTEYVDGIVGDINSVLESIINGGNNELNFPITLITGDNGDVGINLFNYLYDKYSAGDSISEDVYIDSERILYIMDKTEDVIYLRGGVVGVIYILSSTGVMTPGGGSGN